MHAAGKIFVKTYLKAIRDFFPICEISQYVIFLSSRRGKFKLLDLQGDPPPPQFPRLVGYPDLPMRKTLNESGWSAYCNDFLSKQKIYSM